MEPEGRRELLLDVAAALAATALVPLIISLLDGPFSFAEWYGGLLPWSWILFTAVYLAAIRLSVAMEAHMAWRLLNGLLICMFGTGVAVAAFFVLRGILPWTAAWPLIGLAWPLAAPAILWTMAWIWLRSRRSVRAPAATDATAA